MAYRFRPDESFEAGFRRNAKEQIAKAHKYLAFNEDPAKSIHETRKSLKRSRALMRLFRPALGKSDFAHENARYRDIGRLLSHSRDQKVMLDVIDALLADLGDQVQKPAKAKKLRTVFNKIRARLETNSLTPDTAADGARSDMAAKRRAIVMLDDAQHELGILQLKGSGFSTVSRGLRLAYRNGTKAYCDAAKSSEDEVLHEWRKSVQTHWRHMSLLQAAWPEFFLFRAEFAKKLSDTLGWHHDLGMLAKFVRTQSADQLDPKKARLACKYIRSIQERSRTQALEMGSALFADDPDDLVFQIERYWKVAHKNATSKERAGPRTKKDETSRSKFSAVRLFKLPDAR